MVPHSKVMLDQVRHSRSRPDLPWIFMCFGPNDQHSADFFLLLSRQLGGDSPVFLGAQGSDPSHTGLLEPLTNGSFAHSKGMCNILLFPPLLFQIPGALASPFAHLGATHADRFSALVVSQFGRKYSEYFLPGTNPSCLSIYFPPTRGLAYPSEEMDTVQKACVRGVAAPSWRIRPATSQTCHKFEVLPLTRRTKCICATDIGVSVGGRP